VIPESVLRVECSVEPGCDIVEAHGELDLTNADELDEALGATSSRVVILDLTELDYLDSAGMRAIDQIHRRLVGDGRTLLIVAPEKSRAGWVFRVAGFADGVVLESVELAREQAHERRQG
jgi:anti-anti-sigma factor